MNANVRPFPSRAVEGQALWCPAPEHVGPRLWRMGYSRMTEAVCTTCHEARRAARLREELPAWRRALGPWVLVLAFLVYAAACILAAMSGEPLVHPGEGAYPIPTDGERR